MSEFWERNTSAKAQTVLRKSAAQSRIDLRSMQILYNASWDEDANTTSIDPTQTPDDAIAHLVSQGLMPPPFELSRQELFDRLCTAWNKLDERQVTSAFIQGVHDAHPPSMAVFGTYLCFYQPNAQALLAASTTFPGVHGLPVASDHNPVVIHPIQVTARRYIHASMMQHDHAINAMLEFEAFAKQCERNTPAPPTQQALQTFRSMLDALRALPREAGLGQLKKALTGITKDIRGCRRQHIVETLGWCDILQPKESYFSGYYPLSRRPLPPAPAKKEWFYPVCWWAGTDGVNEAAVSRWFPML